MTFPSDINNKNGDQLLTSEDVALRLNISKSSLYDAVKDGRLPKPIRFGGRLRWKPQEIDNWIEEGMPEGGQDD